MGFFDEIAAAVFRGFDRRFDGLRAQNDELRAQLEELKSLLLEMEGKLMVSVSDVEAKLTTLVTLVTDVDTRLGVLGQEVRDLLAGGGGADQATLQRMSDTIDGIMATTQQAKDSVADVP